MAKYTPEDYRELKEAHAAGHTIQCFIPNTNKWIDMKSPSWNHSNGPVGYRIKPTEKRKTLLKL